MRFKERLDILNEINDFDYQEEVILKDDSDLINIFENNPKACEVIKTIVSQNRNVILFCSKEYERSLLCNYFRLFFNKNDSVEVLRNIYDNLSFISADKIIIPEPSIKDVVRVLEYILMGAKTFIFSMNVKNFHNILLSLSTIISLNFPHLSERNINHLIAQSQAGLIFFTVNEDGLYRINSIKQIEYDDTITLKDLYTFTPEDTQDNTEEKETPIQEQPKLQPDEAKQMAEQPQIQNQIQNSDKPAADIMLPVVPVDINIPLKEYKNANTVDDTPNTQNYVLSNKVNKYKLLKLKLKNKNSSNNLN